MVSRKEKNSNNDSDSESELQSDETLDSAYVPAEEFHLFRNEMLSIKTDIG